MKADDGPNMKFTIRVNVLWDHYAAHLYKYPHINIKSCPQSLKAIVETTYLQAGITQ